MRAAFAEYIGALPVESGANGETLEDVAEGLRQGGAVLAFIGATAVGSARFRPEDDALYVNRVAVLPDYRRRGIATAMMRFLEDVARARNRTAIRIGVRESLPSNVLLYEGLGYQTLRVDPHPGGPDRSRTMLKQLSDP